ncbi:MAG TPA: TonB-dependent receptor [Prolixibacteraceae bacterium]|nr:TonB-dependent receptor [Prolixibacteraceae bacterium]
MKKNRFKGFITLWLLTAFMAFSVGLYAQQKVISGTVSDIQGTSLPGVSVVEKGTMNGTITNIDGQYNLSVPNNAQTLVFSYIGMMTQEVTIGSQTQIDVVLKQDIVGLDEVVVVGYGTRLKEELTGAVSTVSEEQMQISSAPSVVSRMQGQISGVTVTSADRPGGDATIRIRGVGTINNANPLYVIDGVPVGPGNNLNPNDVESISVLKDASSAAIYGTRGANGVIIITTKRGRDNQAPSINFSLKTGVSKATNKYDLLNTKEYADAVWLSYKNRGVAPNHAQYGSGATPVIPDYILPAGAMEGDASVNPALYKYPDYLIFKANKEGTDWYDEIYRNAIVQQYDLSVTGGGKNGTYAFSGSYLDEDGILEHTNFKRYTFRMNSDAKFNDWFKAGESLQAMYINEHGNLGDNDEGTVISYGYRSQPIIPVYDIMGNFAGSRASEMGNSGNPVAMLYRARNNNGKSVRIMGNVYSEITIMKGLTAKTVFGYNYSQWNYNGYTIPNLEHSEPTKVNAHNHDSNYSLQWNWTNTVNYNATFNDIHKISAVIGTEAIDNYYQSLNGSRSQFFSEDVQYMQLDAGESNIQNSGNASEWSLFSQFLRFNYDLMSKYYIEGTVRRDGSSRFSEANRYGVFPAVSAGWIISEESFLSGVEKLDILKLRAGYGVSGNDQMGLYNSYTTYRTHPQQAAYDFTGSNTTATAGFIPGNLGNDEVSWETTKTLNIGLDGVFFDRTLSASIDIWQRKTSDMLFQDPIPNVLGIATAPYINIGEMQNKGYDIELGYNNTAFGDKFRYNVTATLSHYKNEITKLSTDPKRTIDAASYRQKTYTRYAVGTAYPEFFGYVVEGIFQTEAEAAAHPKFGTTSYNAPGHYKYKDISGPDGKPDGVITADDRTFIGSPHPDLTGGLNFDLGYGSFDMNLFFYGSYGNDMINYVTRWIDYGMFNGGLSKRALYETWTPERKDAPIAKLDQHANSQEPSTAYIEDASFLRLKNLKLGYTLPKTMLSKAQIKNLHVYVQVTNLFTLTKYRGLDPEVNSSGSNMGVDMGAWPTARQINFGVQLGL